MGYQEWSIQFDVHKAIGTVPAGIPINRVLIVPGIAASSSSSTVALSSVREVWSKRLAYAIEIYK